MSSLPPPHWHLLGAGNMGTLAAYYLQQAGHRITVIGADNSTLEKQLLFAEYRRKLQLPRCRPAQLTRPIDHLLVACKTPFTAQALTPLAPWLGPQTRVLRLQNGIGALDGLLPAGTTVWEAVTTSAVKGQHPDHQIVAENHTWWGGQAQPPAWFANLQQYWPNLHWEHPIRPRQWQKLVANAVINPLTALHDVANGAITEDPQLRQQAALLCAEADRILQAHDADWPGDSLKQVLAVAKATAANTSSMRADRQRGTPMELEAITGYLLRLAQQQQLDARHHRALYQALQRQSLPTSSNSR